MPDHDDDGFETYSIEGSGIDRIMRERKRSKQRKTPPETTTDETIDDRCFIKTTGDKAGTREWLVVNVSHKKDYQIPYENSSLPQIDELAELLGSDAVQARLAANKRRWERAGRPETQEVLLLEVIPCTAIKKSAPVVFEQLKKSYHSGDVSKARSSSNSKGHADLYECWARLAQTFDDKPAFEAHPLADGSFLRTLATAGHGSVKAFVQGHLVISGTGAQDACYTVTNWIIDAGFAKTDKSGAASGTVTATGNQTPAPSPKAPTLVRSKVLDAILEWHFLTQLGDHDGSKLAHAKRKIRGFRKGVNKAGLSFDELQPLLFDYFVVHPQGLEDLKADINGFPGRAMGLIWARFEERIREKATKQVNDGKPQLATEQSNAEVRLRIKSRVDALTRKKVLFSLFANIKNNMGSDSGDSQVNQSNVSATEFCRLLKPLLVKHYFSDDPEGIEKVLAELRKLSFRTKHRMTDRALSRGRDSGDAPSSAVATSALRRWGAMPGSS